MFEAAVAGWPHETFAVSVRYSRGSEYSGTCYYDRDQAYINIGRDNRYPFEIKTHIARARSNRTHWWREFYTLELSDPYQLALFVFMHEFYHWLVRKARRNVRQKEGRCDRFAARALVDAHGAVIRDSQGRLVPREAWDFQDLDGFVIAARRLKTGTTRSIPFSTPIRSVGRQQIGRENRG